jgi:GNAT superfamily N-acetyltransferase
VHYVVQNEFYYISTDPTLLDLDVIHGYLYHSYWSPGVPRAAVEQAIAHSLNFGLYEEQAESRRQIGFARVITDYTSAAYLADVFVLPTVRGQGLGVWLIDSIINCPQLSTLRSFTLATRDAHELYRKFGFEEIDSARYMIKRYDVPWRDPALARE